jgi:hypothetical protein
VGELERKDVANYCRSYERAADIGFQAHSRSDFQIFNCYSLGVFVAGLCAVRGYSSGPVVIRRWVAYSALQVRSSASIDWIEQKVITIHAKIEMA